MSPILNALKMFCLFVRVATGVNPSPEWLKGFADDDVGALAGLDYAAHPLFRQLILLARREMARRGTS